MDSQQSFLFYYLFPRKPLKARVYPRSLPGILKGHPAASKGSDKGYSTYAKSWGEEKKIAFWR